MTRRPNASLVASPVLVGAVTVLVTLVAVVLAYNANNGLPFVPSLDVRVRAENAAALGKGSEVREGGVRVGFVSSIETVRLPNGGAAAEINMQINEAAGELPPDTTFTIRPRSPLGLKYLEMVRGGDARAVEDGHVFEVSQTEIPVQVDDVNRTYDEPTRDALRGNLDDFGNTLAGRGPSLNITLERLPRFLRLAEPVARNLSDPQTRLGRFFRELGDTARVVAPLADTQSDVFTRAALTFEAISSDTEALKQTIERSHPAFQAGIDSFPVQRPFLTDSAALAREMQPVARLLRPTLPLINDALETGTPVTRRSVDFYGDLRPALVVAARADGGPRHRGRAARPAHHGHSLQAAAALPRPLPDRLQLLELLLHLPGRAREPERRPVRVLAAQRDQEHGRPEQQPQLDRRGRAGQRRGLPGGLAVARRHRPTCTRRPTQKAIGPGRAAPTARTGSAATCAGSPASAPRPRAPGRRSTS